MYCDDCQEFLYCDHSCGNRHCPKCGQERADRWRDKQLGKLLPAPYVLVTFTLPHTLNPLARSNQKLFYRLLFDTSAEALHTLALNPTWLGGTIGMVGALHTWDRSMGYHLHVHSLVPGGAIDPQSGEWIPSHPTFLVPGSALRKVFRAKFRDALKAADPELFAQVPPETWRKHWSVPGKAVGDGRTALKYLTPYIYRVALSNRRLVSMKDGNVTFSDTPNDKAWQTMTLPALKCISRFLQHVLPKGFQQVRDFGFLHPGANARFSALKHSLEDKILDPRDWPAPDGDTLSKEGGDTQHRPDHPGVCPHCGGALRSLGRIARMRPGMLPLVYQRGPPKRKEAGSS
ncbi:MAG: transposase [bacterium]|nr:transposase [bacterium]